MSAAIRRRLASERGFTLIELLVVILILGILLAIALPTFLNQQDKAQEVDVKTQLSSAYKVAKSDATSNGNGNYRSAGTLVSVIHDSEPEISVGLVASEDDLTSGQLGVMSANGGDLDLAARAASGRICHLTVTNHGKPHIDCGGGGGGGGGGGPGPGPGDPPPGSDAAVPMIVRASVVGGDGFSHDALYRVNDDGSDPTLILDHPAGEADPAGTILFGLDGDGSKLAFYANRVDPASFMFSEPFAYEGLYVANANGSGQQELPNPCPGAGGTPRFQSVQGLDLSPSGDRLYVVCTAADGLSTSLWRVTVASGAATELFAGDPLLAQAVANPPVVSPDGSTLSIPLVQNYSLYGDPPAGASGVYVAATDGSSLALAKAESASGLKATWTTDGRIAYFRSGTGDADPVFGIERLHLATADADGANATDVQAGSDYLYTFFYTTGISFSGDHLAYNCMVDMDSFSNGNRICTSVDGEPVQSFNFAGRVLDIAYLP